MEYCINEVQGAKAPGVTVDPTDLIPLVDEGLGNSAYLLDLGDGRALAVDPPRDLRAAAWR
jgi:hypothetical protein